MILGLVASKHLDRLPQAAPPFLRVTDTTPRVLQSDYRRDIPQSVIARETCVAARAAAVLYSSATIARRAPADFDWQRKGGDTALGALRHLRAGCCDTHLTLVGAAPDGLAGEPGVEVAGFLDKNRPRDAARLSSLYARAHLLVLPSRGDCTPMVLGEAMAHGTPVLASDIGGIAESVGRGGAGDTLPPGAPPEDWARRIREMTRDAAARTFLSDAARDRAEARFFWAAWARGIETTARRVSMGRVLRAAV